MSNCLELIAHALENIVDLVSQPSVAVTRPVITPNHTLVKDLSELLDPDDFPSYEAYDSAVKALRSRSRPPDVPPESPQ